MRWAALLLALVAAGAIGAGAWAIVRSHDTPPERVTACATDRGARIALGEEGLGFARADIADGRVRIVRRYRLDNDAGVLLAGDGYRILVIGTPRGPRLTGRRLPFRVYRQTATFARVLTERDPVKALDACARRV